MTATKFTKGEWHKHTDPTGRTVIVDAVNKKLIEKDCLAMSLAIVTRFMGREAEEANAHLIAASPDLYAALELARERIINAKATARGRDVVMEAIDAALKKARGEA